MVRFSANLGFLFTEVPLLDRFQAAAAAGFHWLEFKSPYDYDLKELKKRADAYGLEFALINMPDGDWGAGDRGLAADPGRRAEFRDSVPRALEAAEVLGAPRVNCLLGNAPADTEWARIEANLVENLDFAAWELAKVNRDLTAEPLNSKDNPQFCRPTVTLMAELLEKVHHENVYLQYDVYHEAQEGQDLIGVLQKYAPRIGHIQVADLPGRHEPGSGAVDYTAWFQALEGLNYKGFVGMEYNPAVSSQDSLRWLEKYGYKL